MALNRITELSIGPAGETGVLVKDLRMNFVVEKSDKESANRLNLLVYNLGRDTSDRIARAKNKVVLRAGYEDEGVTSLFFGDVVKVVDRKAGPDRLLDIEAYDGHFNIQNKNVSLSFAEGSTRQQVFNDVVSIFGLPLTNQGLTVSGQYANGWAFVGKARDALTEVLAPIGKSWTIQNEQLVIITPGEVVQRTGLLISPSTGLIGSPEALSDQDERQVETEDVPKRWKIKSLLFPQIFPGAELRIESDVVNGAFKVETVVQSGDNYEGEFVSEAEVVQV